MMMVTADAPEYVTVGHAAAMMDCKPWEVVQLVRRDEIRCVEHDGMALVSAYDVETLGGCAVNTATTDRGPGVGLLAAIERYVDTEVSIERAVQRAEGKGDIPDLHQRRDAARAAVLALVDRLAGHRAD